MSDAYQLVINLLLLGLKLHAVGERLPFASAADSEMWTERFQPVRRRGHKPQYITLHVVFLLFGDLDVDCISRHGKRDEQYRPVDFCDSLALGGHTFYLYVFEYDFLFLSHFHELL